MATIVVTPSQDIASIINNANSIDKIYPTAGNFLATDFIRCVNNVGVEIVGAGRGADPASNTVISFAESMIFPNHIDTSGTRYKEWQAVAFQYGNIYGSDDASAQVDAGGARIGGFRLRGNRETTGQGRWIYGGIIFHGVKNFQFEGWTATDFYYIATRFINCSDFVCRDFDCDYSSNGDASSYRVGNMIASGINNFLIADGSFSEAEGAVSVGGYPSGGGGGGFTTKESTTNYNPSYRSWLGGGHDPNFYCTNGVFRNLNFSGMQPLSQWAGSTGNLDLELHNCLIDNIRIEDCVFQGTLSLVHNDHELPNPSGDWRIKVLNCFFDTDGTYPVEMAHSHIEIAGCTLFAGGSGPIFAEFEDDPSYRDGIAVHDCYIGRFQGSGYGGEAAIYLLNGGDQEFFYFFNNTVNFENRDSVHLIVAAKTLSYFYCYNNIFFNVTGASRSFTGPGSITNCYMDTNLCDDHTGNMTADASDLSIGTLTAIGNLEGDPLFVGSGGIPDQYAIQASSPAAGAGVDRNKYNYPYPITEVQPISSPPDLGFRQLGATASCTLSVSVNPGVCNGLTYALQVNITGSSFPTNDTATIKVSPDNVEKTISMPSGGSGSTSTVIENLVGDAGSRTVRVEFNSDGTCFATTTYVAPNCGASYATSGSGINCAANSGNGEFSWTNVGVTSLPGVIQRRVNGDPNWRDDVTGIALLGDGVAQNAALTGVIQNAPPDQPYFDIAGLYRYKLVVGAYETGEFNCVRFLNPNLRTTNQTDTVISLAWDMKVYPGDEGLFTFKLQRYNTGTLQWDDILTQAMVSGQTNYTYSDTGRTAGTLYTYRLVQEFDGFSVQSTYTPPSAEEVAVTTTGTGSDPYYPQNLVYDRSFSNTVSPFLQGGQEPGAATKIRWTNQGNPTGQWVCLDVNVNGGGWEFVSLHAAGTFASVQEISGPPLRISDNFQYIPGEYQVRLRYGDSALQAAPSNLALGTATAETRKLIWFNQVSLSVLSKTTTSFTLSFVHRVKTGDENLFGYRVQISDNGGDSWNQVADVVGQDTATVNDLINGREYQIRVKVYHVASGEESEFSNIVTDTPTPGPTIAIYDPIVVGNCENGTHAITVPIQKSNAPDGRVVIRIGGIGGNLYLRANNGQEYQDEIIENQPCDGIEGVAVDVWYENASYVIDSSTYDAPSTPVSLEILSASPLPCGSNGVHTLEVVVKVNALPSTLLEFNGSLYNIPGKSGTYTVSVIDLACEDAVKAMVVNVPGTSVSRSVNYTSPPIPAASEGDLSIKRVVSGPAISDGTFPLTIIMDVVNQPTNRTVKVLGKTFILSSGDGEKSITIHGLVADKSTGNIFNLFYVSSPDIGDQGTYDSPGAQKQITIQSAAIKNLTANSFDIEFTILHSDANGEVISLLGDEVTITTDGGIMVYTVSGLSLTGTAKRPGFGPDLELPTNWKRI